MRVIAFPYIALPRRCKPGSRVDVRLHDDLPFVLRDLASALASRNGQNTVRELLKAIRDTPDDEQLGYIVTRWPSLTKEQRAEVLLIVEAAEPAEVA